MLPGFIKTGLDPLLRRVARRIEFLHQIKVEQESRTSATIDPSALIYPSAQVNNLSGDPTAIVVGAHSVLRGDLMTFWSGGSIKLGEWCYVGQDARIWSEASIEIGNHVLISHLVDIQDSNSHPIDWRERSRDGEAVLSGHFDRRPTIEVAPIVIEDDAWICFKASIMKGVRVGRGSIVAAGSVVTKDVPPWSLVAGNPARVVRTFSEEGADSLS